MENKNYTDKRFWDNYFQGKSLRPLEHTTFADIFLKYLEPGQTKHAFEVGCAGGNYLAYLAKYLGYKASGIDYSDEIERTRKLFEFYGLPEPTLYKEDFFSFKPPQPYDVVCSFGFIEHFDNPSDIIRQHAKLVAPGGTLIITMPNFGYGQYLLHWLIDRDNLKKHNIKTMDLETLRNSFRDLPFTIKNISYYKTFGFWTERKDLKSWERMIQWSTRRFGKLLNITLGYDHPNRFFSPHIVCVAQRNI